MSAVLLEERNNKKRLKSGEPTDVEINHRFICPLENDLVR